MRRKEFMQQLLKISELNRQVNCLKDTPLLFCRQTQIEERPVKKDSSNPVGYLSSPDTYAEPHELKRKEVLILISEKNIRRPGSAAKQQSGGNRKQEEAGGSANRLKTTPHSSSRRLKGGFEVGSLRKMSEVEGNCNGILRVQHYLQVKEIQQFVPSSEKKVEMSGQGLDSGGRSRRYGQKEGKKYSLTQPTEPKDSLGVGMVSSGTFERKAVQGSGQKYESVGRGEGREEAERRNKLSMRKQINRNYTKPYMPPPKVSAKSYIIYELLSEGGQSKVVVSFNSKNAQEVASLTKIMTCVVTLEICSGCGVDRWAEEVTVGRMEAGVGGTTASLSAGQIYTVYQLLLGLMLPSGNDASVALAVWGGRKLLQREGYERKEMGLQETICQSVSTNRQTSRSKATKTECYARFLQEMNAKAQSLGMSKTNYANSHGLMNMNNKSSAFDIALLCEYAMRKQEFRDIVQCRSYRGTIKALVGGRAGKRQKEESEGQSSESDEVSKKYSVGRRVQLSPKRKEEGGRVQEVVEWQNTHKLMQLRPKEYIGIKTGFTKSAGPCLSSCVSVQSREFVIVVLGCARMSLRFKETEILKRWLYKHLKLRREKGGVEGQGQAKCVGLIEELNLNGDQEVED